MKKVLTIALMAVPSLTIDAQVKTKWTSTKYEGKALTGMLCDSQYYAYLCK